MAVNVVLISTYELGRQPFGLASPAAWLRPAGASVTCLDLAQQGLDEEAVRGADVVAFYVPMHTATRIAARAVGKVRALNPTAHLCFYGLYAPVNEGFLRELGADTILGGEFEAGLVSLLHRLRGESGGTAGGPQPEPLISLAKQKFLIPDRSGLPALSTYAYVNLGEGRRRTVGYTEASRGCKHHCRHCPVVPVYEGHFRVVQRDVVLEDIRQQVAAGAEHITFGDPDFFNGVGHALAIVRALHEEHPTLTYDVTIKIEHLLTHAQHLPTLRETGCLFVTSAVESVDNRVLAILDKGHTREDFIRVVHLCRAAGVALTPTFVTFTPWISLEGYQELLWVLAELELIEHVPPIQLAIRLLIPAGSKLLEVPEVRELVGAFDPAALVYPWKHPDPRVDQLHEEVFALVKEAEARGLSRREIFAQVWERAERAANGRVNPLPEEALGRPRATIPYLSEPWYC
ncbi:MAG: CUAEP/CCAEP-tail radical SAM protein [candidate division NC10 bacterium]|nr:CUAEP/CCAEP-tail radical SAM protein [candidate division NC10 bacterium]